MRLAVGAVASVSSLALLRLAWARKQNPRGVLIATAWLLVLLSLVAWGMVTGEPGVAAGVLMLAALGTSYAGYLFARAPVAQERRQAPREAEVAATGANLARRLCVFVLAGPLAAIATSLLCGLCFALVVRVGGATADAVVLASMLAPPIWGALLCWMLMDSSLLRRSLGIVGAAALGAVAFVLT